MLRYGRLCQLPGRLVSPRCGCQCHSTAADTATVSDDVRVRFAPSPTGHLHIGGLRTALYNFLFARSHGGKFVLRIEDTDQSRLVPGVTENMMEMLEWSNIKVDEGPFIGGDHGPYIQSHRLELYKEMLEILLKNGTAYRCFCSPRRLDLLRKEALRQREIPRYDNKCRHLAASEVQEKLASGAPYTVRFKLEPHPKPWQDLVYGPITTDVASIEGDPILMKSDGYPTYHFANIVDDHFMKITHVLRGMEWQVSTTKHLLLYKAFGWTPPKYAHLPLLLNKDGKKLSKRQGDISVERFKKEGFYPETVLNLLTSAGSGFKVKDTTGMDMDQLVDSFSLSQMTTNSTRVDVGRLHDLNRRHLTRRLDDPHRGHEVTGQLITMVTQKYGTELATNPQKSSVTSDKYITDVLDWAKVRIHKLSDLLQPDYRYLWVPPTAGDIRAYLSAAPAVSAAACTHAELIAALRDTLRATSEEDYTADLLKGVLKDLSHQKGLQVGSSMQVWRAALSGLREGPSIAEILSTLGRATSISRLEYSLKALENT